MKHASSLRQQFLDRRPYLDAWGSLVADTVKSAAERDLVDSYIFEVPPKHRVKEVNSFLVKALSPKKNYPNPIEDIEDQVGVRFVVLLMSQVAKIGAIIEGCSLWTFKKSRDLLSERENEPMVFTYQSDHYVVRNRDRLVHGGAEIPAGSACEIQIRTLLQHAYSQLTHDLTYKPRQALTAGVHRCNARSMALIEVTDELFSNAAQAKIEANKEIERVLRFCRGAFFLHLGQVPAQDTAVEATVLDAYASFLPALTEQILEATMKSSTYQNWRKRHGDHFLFPFATTAALFSLIPLHPLAVQKDWPLARDLLESIVTACGEKILHE